MKIFQQQISVRQEWIVNGPAGYGTINQRTASSLLLKISLKKCKSAYTFDQLTVVKEELIFSLVMDAVILK